MAMPFPSFVPETASKRFATVAWFRSCRTLSRYLDPTNIAFSGSGLCCSYGASSGIVLVGSGETYRFSSRPAVRTTVLKRKPCRAASRILSDFARISNPQARKPAAVAVAALATTAWAQNLQTPHITSPGSTQAQVLVLQPLRYSFFSQVPIPELEGPLKEAKKEERIPHAIAHAILDQESIREDISSSWPCEKTPRAAYSLACDPTWSRPWNQPLGKRVFRV